MSEVRSTALGSFHIPSATQHAFPRLGRNRGVGGDDLPAELLVAGGAPAAILCSSVNLRVAQNASWLTLERLRMPSIQLTPPTSLRISLELRDAVAQTMLHTLLDPRFHMRPW